MRWASAIYPNKLHNLSYIIPLKFVARKECICKGPLSHIAFSVGSKANVDKLTEELRKRNFKIVSEARNTGDGYYESCVLDSDNNRVEITE